jgi:hypothetical protein
MADRELIAAILTAGMLPTLEIPRSRVEGRRRPLNGAEAEAIHRALDHAFGLYRLVLNGLGVDPLSVAETGAQQQAPADVTRNSDQTSHSPVEVGARWEHSRSAFIDPLSGTRTDQVPALQRHHDRSNEATRGGVQGQMTTNRDEE